MPISAAKVFVIIVGVLMVLLGVSNIVTAVKVYLDGKYIDDGSDVVWEE
jgi:TRAP-type mannitol/chloroaromatic compound transport system permease small subunit